MLKSVLPVLCVCLALNVWGQFSSIAIQNIENEPFFLYVNGNLINDKPSTYARVDNLWDGFYWLKIVINPQTEPIILEKKVPLLGLNNLSFVLRKKKGKYKMSLQALQDFAGIFRMPEPVFRVPFPTFPNPRREEPEPPIQKPNPEPQTEPETNKTEQPMPTDRYAMRVLDSEFEEIKRNIKEESNDEEKLRIAKFSMKNTGYFSSEQVAEIVALVGFEEFRLDLAKFAYDYVYDRYQYYTKVSRSLKTNEARKMLFEFLEKK
ncbi:MAG: DUF4476 domain-containing protein [Raineya sp.]|nr:DUF4476 domain-containing protein [Raineya sp.]